MDGADNGKACSLHRPAHRPYPPRRLRRTKSNAAHASLQACAKMRNTHSGHVAVQVHSARLETRPLGTNGPPPLCCVAEIECGGRSSTSETESSGGSAAGGIRYEWEEVRSRPGRALGLHARGAPGRRRSKQRPPPGLPPALPQSLAFYVGPSDRAPHLKLVLRRPSAGSQQGQFVAAGSLGLDPLLGSGNGGSSGNGGGGAEGPQGSWPRSHQVSVQMVDEVGKHAGAVQATLHVTPRAEGGGEAAPAPAPAGRVQTCG